MKKAILATAVAMAATGAMAWQDSEDGFSHWADAEVFFEIRQLKNHDEDARVDRDDTIKLSDDSGVWAGGQWRMSQPDGRFVTAVADIGLYADGDVGMDDAFIAFGQKDDWFLQLGRFRGINLNPLGKDTAYSVAMGTDNRRYTFDTSQLYVYRATESRGRPVNGNGQFRLHKQMGGLSAEVSTQFGETHYTDDTLNDNSIMVRPAVSYSTDDGFMSLALGGEWEARKADAEVPGNATNKVSDRYGVAATTTLNFGSMAWTLNGGYQHVDNFRKAYSVNTNVDAGQWGLGFTYAQNNYHNDFKNNVTDYKNPKGYTVYTAYTVPLLGFENAEVSFGLSYSETQNRVIDDSARKDEKDRDLVFATSIYYLF